MQSSTGLTLASRNNTMGLFMTTYIDLHVHTTKGSSDSSLSPESMVLEAKRLGLPGLCITEHNAPWDPHQFIQFARQYDLLLIRGVEVNTDMGHVLVFGSDDSRSYLSGMNKISELRRVVKEMDGFMVTAHPFRGLQDPRPNVRPLLYGNGAPLPASVGDAASHPVFGMVDAIEVANGSTVDAENAYAWQVAQHLHLKGTGGSDAHSVRGLGRCITVFEDDIRTEAEFLQALRLGRYQPAHGLRAGKIQPFLG